GGRLGVPGRRAAVLGQSVRARARRSARARSGDTARRNRVHRRLDRAVLGGAAHRRLLSGDADKPTHLPRLYLRRRGRRTRAQARALDTLAPRYCLAPDAPIEPAAVVGRAAPSAPPRRSLRRRGRRSRARARALATLAPRYCLAPDAPIEPAAVFGRAAPFGVEIGFGMGHALIDWALTRPDWNLLGIDVYEPGIGSALLGIERHGLGNVRLVEGDAEQVLERCIAPDSVDEVRIFFPDPWPKKRHHKRRLVQPGFVALLARRLRPGGLVWLATDWEEYAQWITAVFAAEPAFEALRPPQVESGQ